MRSADTESHRDSVENDAGDKSESHGFIPRYIFLHIRRSAWKSVLALALATLMLCAVGQLVLMQRSYGDLFRSTSVTARISIGISLSSAVRLAGSELTKNPYYEATGKVDANFQTVGFAFTNNISRYTGEEASITYADGYDETCMDQLGNVIIVEEPFFVRQELELGDTIPITFPGLYDELKSNYVERFMYMNPGSDLTEEEIIALNYHQITQDVLRLADRFKVVGVVAFPSETYNGIVFSPGIYEPRIIGMPALVDMAEYTIADNERIGEFSETCKKIIGGSNISSNVIIDTAKIENIQNTRRLLGSLYPMAAAAALLIGGFLSCLMILQSSKDAAIMRVLGATKRKVRAILSLEQLLLSVAGSAIGAFVMLLLRKAKIAAISRDLTLFASLYAAIILATAAACSVLVTRRSALELLQTKE